MNVEVYCLKLLIGVWSWSLKLKLKLKIWIEVIFFFGWSLALKKNSKLEVEACFKLSSKVSFINNIGNWSFKFLKRTWRYEFEGNAEVSSLELIFMSWTWHFKCKT